MNRKSERRPDIVFAAVPEGSQRAARASHWLATVKNHPDVLAMNSQGRRNLIIIATLLLPALVTRTMTTSPGWDYLIRKALVSEKTVERHLKRLAALGLLGVVASGRLAGFTPKSSGQQINERAVYVLCVPHGLRSVDKSDGPTVRELRSNPLHAREETSPTSKGAATPPETHSGTAPGGVAAKPPGHRRHTSCSLRKTVAGTTRGAFRNAAEVAVQELMEHSLALRHARPAFLAWVCRPFFVAGWTPKDVLHAIDNRPDSTRIPHDAAEGVRPENLARWAQSRLSHWLSPAGAPMQSNSQRIAAEGQRLKAQARAAAEKREAELQALATASVQPVSEEKARALAAIRALYKTRHA